MSLYSTAVQKPITTILFFVAIAIMGIFSLSKLPIDLYPSMDQNTIMVITAYPGANAADIETNVSRPIENVLNGVSDVKHIASRSKENISIVSLEFEFGIDLEVATNDVRDKLDMVATMLPDGVDNPTLFKFGTDDIPILMLSVEAKESFSALYKILDDKVVSPINRVGGVGSVSISGVPAREIQVYCDPLKLEAYNVTIETIASLIRQENSNTPGGTLDIGTNTYSLRMQGEFADPMQLLNIVVASKDDRNVYLRDVARVEDTTEERAQETYNNGKLGGMIVVQKQAGANSVAIAEDIIAKLPDIQKSLPTDVKLGIIVNTSDNIVSTISSLKETIILTFLIVMVVVLVFLGRWRATFIIVLTIPISLVGAFMYLLASDNSLNIISLSSLSIAIGMVVDDAIVVLENITTHIERGSKPRQAAIHATNEVAISVVASTLTMLAVFLPLTMISGMTGILFRQLGWMVSIIMIVSTISALTLTPMLCSIMLRHENTRSKLQIIIFTPIERFLDMLDRGYVHVLNWSARHRWIVVTIAVLIFASSIMLSSKIKTEFFPTNDNGQATMMLELPVGTGLNLSREFGLRVADNLMKDYPEIINCNFTVGQADTDNIWATLSDNGNNILEYNIKLVGVEGRERGVTEICDLIRKQMYDDYPELQSYTVTAGGGGGGLGGQAGVEIEIYGHDFNTSDQLASELYKEIIALESCSEVNLSRDEYVPEYQVEFDREKLAVHGLNFGSASLFVRNRINGTIASYYREEGEEYDIKVRYAPEDRASLEDLENIVIYNNQGDGIKVRDLGVVVEKLTPPTIERKDRERIVTVTAVVAQGYALSDLVNEVTVILGATEIPEGLTYILAGSFEDQQETFGDLFSLMILIIILVFIVMASQFESMVDPFVIMFSIPFAFTGVIFGLVITGVPLGVMAMIGLIMLIGIVVKNGIVLIDYTILCRDRGMGVIRAVVTAGKSRLRPVLMTTLTTVLGMLPMALGTGEGSELWKSMGMAVAWGLSISTMVTLIIVPTIYAIFASNGIKKKRKNHRKALRNINLQTN